MKKIIYATVPVLVLFCSACGREDTGNSTKVESADADQPTMSADSSGGQALMGDIDIPSGVYSVDPMHTYLTFSYSHLDYSYPLLRATGIDGELVLDADDMSNSSVAIAVDASSIDTQLPKFDEELQSLQYFDAANHPWITYRTESYEPNSTAAGTLHGQLTVKGLTQPMSLDVVINNAMMHPMSGKPVIGFSATGTLSRSEFGLARNVPFVGDEVRIDIEVEFAEGSSEASLAAATLALNAGGANDADAGVADVGTGSDGSWDGHWAVTTTGFSSTGGKSIFDLSIERDGDRYVGWIFNGPTTVSIDGNNIVVDIDWIEGADSTYRSQLIGTKDESGQLSGQFMQLDASRFNSLPLKDGAWSAHKIEEAGAVRKLEDVPPAPVDISGIWRGAGGKGGFNKLNYAMTPAAMEVRDNFKDMDAPHIRCAGYGLITVKRFGGTIYPLEIIQADDQVTLLYGADYIRRIYLDDREYPENREDTDMGFSIGKWVGETLVVTTTHITPNFFRAGHGMPISGNAYTTEHYFLDDDGYLRADMWVHDPENYERAPYFPAYLDKNFSDPVITHTGCDAYSFIRQMHADGELEEFLSRGEYRR